MAVGVKRYRLSVEEQLDRQRQLNKLRTQRRLTPEEMDEADWLTDRQYIRVRNAQIRARRREADGAEA